MTMQPVDDYKYFGLLSVVILLSGLLFVVYKWSHGTNLTFSQTVAKQKHSIIYYSTLFSIVLPLLLLFFIDWLTPEFQLSVWFSIFIVVSSVTQLFCTFIPEVGGWKTKYHRALAGISALCLIPALLFLIVSNSIGAASRAIAALSLIVMLGIIFVLIKQKGIHTHLLVLQSVYFIAFFAPILTASYL
jgi:hypothetical protein